MMRERFFVKYPALIVSLFFLLGLAASFQCIFLLFTALSLVFFLRSPQRLLGYLLISSLAYSYGLWKLEQFPSTETSLQGFAACTIQTIQESKTHFSTGYIGKGFIHSLIDEEGKKAANISCYIQIPAAMRPLSTKHYLIHGTLEKKEEGKFRFIPTKDLPWVPGKTATLCLAELRFTITCYLQKRIESLYPSPRIHHFLCALLLG
ncbi:MAG: hypothetical protein FJZ58_04990, partial [Chlamydiae bacterium]|nr:hypothetical protein [Chlamydiota bacterium]